MGVPVTARLQSAGARLAMTATAATRARRRRAADLPATARAGACSFSSIKSALQRFPRQIT